jgi:hypothetical protein
VAIGIIDRQYCNLFYKNIKNGLMKENLLCIDSLILESYQNLNFAVFIKDRNSGYLWGNDFFVSQSSGFSSLAEIINKKDEDLPWRDYTDELTNKESLR